MILTDYRAWDKKNKKMLYPSQCDDSMDYFEFYPEGFSVEWCLTRVTANKIREEKILESTDGVLMQFTGRKDKNGTKIYSGDILKLKWKHGKEKAWTVECPKLIPEYFHWHSELEDMFIEVIGNIYKNPELLKINF